MITERVFGVLRIATIMIHSSFLPFHPPVFPNYFCILRLSFRTISDGALGIYQREENYHRQLYFVSEYVATFMPLVFVCCAKLYYVFAVERKMIILPQRVSQHEIDVNIVLKISTMIN